MRLLLFAAACSVACAADAGLSPYEIVRRSCLKDMENAAVRQQYTYRHTDKIRVLDGKGGVKRNEFHVKEVLWIDGTHYSRLIEKDGKPLSEKQAREEREKLDKEIAKRKRESASQRQKRLADERKELAEEEQVRLQIPEAYTFQLTGEEAVNARPCYRIAAEPKPGFKPKGKADILPKLRGTLWIDKEDYAWARVDAVTLDTISIGLIFLRMAKGARLEVEQAFINNELWAPSMARVTADARALLLMKARFDALLRFHDYRKYSVDSVVTVAEEQ